MPRTITVVSTKTNKKSTITSSAEAWGGLKTDLSRAGIEYNGMSAVIRETRNNMELDDARLPEGPFTLFLMPKKVKSGTKPVKKAQKASKPTPKSVKKESPKVEKVSDKQVETMKVEAKKLGIKVTMKIAKSDPKYNATYKRLFEAEKANLPKPGSKAPAKKPAAQSEKQIPKQPAQKEEQEVDNTEELLREARAMQGRV